MKINKGILISGSIFILSFLYLAIWLSTPPKEEPNLGLAGLFTAIPALLKFLVIFIVLLVSLISTITSLFSSKTKEVENLSENYLITKKVLTAMLVFFLLIILGAFVYMIFFAR